MRMNNPGAVVYNAYINGLMKGGNSDKAEEIFKRMKKDACKPTTETYTMLINLYGKVSLLRFFVFSLKFYFLHFLYDSDLIDYKIGIKFCNCLQLNQMCVIVADLHN